MLAPALTRRGGPARLGWSAVVAGVLFLIVLLCLLLLVPASRPRGGAALPAAGVRPPVSQAIASGTLAWGRAPSFSLPLLTGGQAGPRTWQGHPILLAFWGSWCLPCRAEAPLLVRLAARYGRDGLVVVLVDEGDSPAAARRAVRVHGLPFPVVMDENATVKGWYAVAGVPTMALISRTGQLLSLHPGALTEGEAPAFLKPALIAAGVSGAPRPLLRRP